MLYADVVEKSFRRQAFFRLYADSVQGPAEVTQIYRHGRSRNHSVTTYFLPLPTGMA